MKGKRKKEIQQMDISDLEGEEDPKNGGKGDLNGGDDLPIFIAERSCRDVLCTLLFVAFFLGMIALAVFAVYRDSDPRRLISGYDKFGNTCGRKNKPIKGAKYSGMDTSDYLYHYDQSGFDICVRKCPSESLDTIETLQELFDSDIRMCKYDIGKEEYAFDGGVLCAVQNSDGTHPFIFDCVSTPKSNTVIKDQFEVAKRFVDKLYADCYTLRKVILTMVGLSVPLSFLWMVILRYFSRLCVYGVIIVGLLGFSGSTAFMWLAYYGKIYIREAAVTHTTLWFAGTILATIISSLACCLTVSMLKRIHIAIAILEEATKFVASVPMILIQPLYAIFFTIFAWIVFSTLIFSLVVPNVPIVEEDGFTVRFENDSFRFLSLLPLFFMLWVCQITNDSTEYVIAGSMARWYFTRDKKRLKSPILNTIRDLLTYHFGSIAFGSFLIAVLKFVRAVMYYVAKRLESAQLNLCQSCLSCIQCFLSCFEKSIKFLTRNAYIEMAISGKGFLTSAKDSFKFMVDHALSLVALNAITFILLWFSRFIIVLIISFSAFYWQKNHYDDNQYNYSFSAAVVSGLVAFYVAHIFMDVYDMSIDSLFYCFCKDKDHHKSTGKAYYMSKDLMKLVYSKKKSMKRSLSLDI
ncbi:MAG: hypothetical protein MHMPM18_000701 [Marteilia pararefringens]